MAITIENPTAEAAYAALLQLPESELLRLKAMFDRADYQDHWSEEDIADASGSTDLLIEKRFGAETVSYD